MIKRIFQKYRTAGFRGLKNTIVRRLFHSNQPVFNPIQVALDSIFADGNFTIIQIGAYIGNSSNDPLFQSITKQLKKGKGRLVCVEPVKKHFDALVKNYRDTPNVICENAAIADRDGQAMFYTLGVNPVEHGYPDWLSQLGSLKKERMESLWDRYEANDKFKSFYLKHRVEEIVNCITFQELMRRHNIAAVDLLQIDTEGYELEILATIDFSNIPRR